MARISPTTDLKTLEYLVKDPKVIPKVFKPVMTISVDPAAT